MSKAKTGAAKRPSTEAGTHTVNDGGYVVSGDAAAARPTYTPDLEELLRESLRPSALGRAASGGGTPAAPAADVTAEELEELLRDSPRSASAPDRAASGDDGASLARTDGSAASGRAARGTGMTDAELDELLAGTGLDGTSDEAAASGGDTTLTRNGDTPAAPERAALDEDGGYEAHSSVWDHLAGARGASNNTLTAAAGAGATADGADEHHLSRGGQLDPGALASLRAANGGGAAAAGSDAGVLHISGWNDLLAGLEGGASFSGSVFGSVASGDGASVAYRGREHGAASVGSVAERFAAGDAGSVYTADTAPTVGGVVPRIGWNSFLREDDDDIAHFAGLKADHTPTLVPVAIGCSLGVIFTLVLLAGGLLVWHFEFNGEL